MYDVLLQLAVKLNKTRKKKQWWHRAVSAMAMTVIFCTTYALILPAITMQKDAVCGFEEHIHSELCYEQYRFECDLASFDKVLHKHDELCYNAEGILICPMQQLEEHIHGEQCYKTEQLLSCEFVHTHDENCSIIGEGKLVCEIPESEGHTHNQSCTAYNEELTCELQEGDVHTHSDSCYTEETVYCDLPESEGHTHDENCGSYQDVLICEKEETEPHIHSDACYTEIEQPCEKRDEEGHECDENCVATETELTCDIEETEGHSHDESCYQQQYTPCDLPETEGHTHSESCAITNRVLNCEIEENVPHVHGEQCYTRTEIPCEIAESEGHVHSESCYDFSDAECSITSGIEHEHTEECYQQQKTLVCEMQELVCHTHDQSCMTEDGQTIICEKQQIAWHQHTENCVKSIQQGEAKLICQLNEHIHTNDCYSLKGGKTDKLQFICGLGVHSHVQDCYDEQHNLICTIPEHHHTAECVVEDIDLTAGVESREEWNEMIAQLPLTGHWPSDIVTIAQNQQGYAEHSSNVVLTNDGVLNGYSRYGDWFGDKYADWNAPFASFVLSYAGVNEFPVFESDAAQWKFDLEAAGSFALPEEYTPKAGDLVFLKDTSDDETPVVDYYPIDTENTDITEDTDNEQSAAEEIENTENTDGEAIEQPSIEESEPTDKPEVEGTENTDNTEDTTSEQSTTAEDEISADNQNEENPDENELLSAPDEQEEYQQSDAAVPVKIIKIEKDPEEIDYDSDSFEGEIPSTVTIKGKDTEERVLGENTLRSIPAPKTMEQIGAQPEEEKQPSDEPEEYAEYLVAVVTEICYDRDGNPDRIITTQGDYDDEVAEVEYSIDDDNIVGYAVIPEGDMRVLTYQGEGYTVTVQFGSDANIPNTAALDVREILPDTDEYADYYNQSVETLLGTEVSEEQVAEAVSSARFFDVSFVDGENVIEPSAMVQVQIYYSEAINKTETEQGVALHFAETGLEIMAAETSQTNELRQDHVDTFAFEQDSFSVVGVMMLNMNRAIGVTSATPINFNQLEAGGDIYYVIYTQYNGQYYALTSKTGDVTGYSVPITMNTDGTISWDTVDESMFWTFQHNGGNSYYVQNYSSLRYIHAFDNSSGSRVDYGTLTGGRNPSTLTASGTGFIAQGNRYYTRLYDNSGTITFNRGTQQSSSATTLYIAQVGRFHNIWFDGTNGGLMQLYGSDDINYPVAKVPGVDTITVELPETWKSPTKYPYRLKGWYDINACKYYAVDPTDDVVVTAQVTGDTVFYADWVAASYDIGFNNSNVVPTVDSSEFVTTYVFDYSALFNLLSAQHTGTISSASHTETWNMLNNGEISPHSGEKSLNFVFVDYDGGGDISYANNRQPHNNSQGGITDGIIEIVENISGQDLLKILFDPEVEVIGKEYVGQGNYLFHYVELGGDDEDGVYDGFYTFDAREHAAAYNQTEQRFYLYDYLERSSDTRKDAGGSTNQYSDFMPFNSPYIFDEDQVDVYSTADGGIGYEYDSKGGNSYPEYNSADDAMVNYMFGLRSDADFYLAYPSGSKDQFDNYLNTTTSGEHLIFEFHGDDDLWVFVDGELLLDVGGIHGVMYGEINFSTGTVYTGKEGETLTPHTFEEVLGHQLDEGAHVMSIYYLERGGSQSNCTLYFNVVPRYTLNIVKEDIYSLDLLDGAEFSVYTDEACGVDDRAQLWDSKADYHADMDDGEVDDAKYKFEVVDGEMSCWGLAAGKTYYIQETASPDGYPYGDDIIRITLNDRGSSEIETTTLIGPDDTLMEGFGVVEQMIDDKLQQITLTLTNQKREETTKLRVKKVWDGEALELPPSVTMQLMVDGEAVGRTATLTDEEGWVYTWTGLPKYEDDGKTEVTYEVRESQVPGFETEPPTYKYDVAESIEWTRTGKMQDRNTYLLVNSGRALSYNASDGFGWMDLDEAEDVDTGKDAQWEVTTNEHGFRLTNRSGYIITYSNDSGNGTFFGGQSAESDVNQIIYYVDNQLLIHDHDKYLQFSVDGEAVEKDGLVFSLYRMDTVTGTVAEVFNKLLPNEDRTFMQVTKVWDDKDQIRDHSEDQVTVMLYANGVPTGRSVILSPINSWTARFDGLPYYAEDKVTPITYTAVEQLPRNYEAEYTVGTMPGETIVTWKRATDFSQSGDYRITSGSHALSIVSSTPTVVQNSDDSSLYWEIVKSGSNTYLRHKNTRRFLRVSGSNLTTNTNQWYATPVTMEGDAIKIGNYYLRMSANSVSLTSYSFNSTYFTVSVRTEGTGKSGISVTVTNHLNPAYQLPNTGGGGTTPYYVIGGLLTTAAVSIYICKFGRKRRIEGG